MTTLGAEARSTPLLQPPEPSPRSPSPGQSVFGEWLVLRDVRAGAEGPSCFPLPCAEQIARALRGALLRHAIDPPPLALSGHTPEGRPLEQPHTAFLALPDLRSHSASARVAGVALALPRGIEPEERQAILLAAARWERSGLRLVLGRLGAMQLARIDAPAPGDLLAPACWLGPSRRWASVTPIALHHNPGALTARDPAKAARAARRAEAIVADACAHIGLPRPTCVRVMRRSLVPGIPSAPDFMPFPRRPRGTGPDRFQRVCVHAELAFAEPVEGPVLLGAGRYFGVGLFGAIRPRHAPSRFNTGSETVTS